MRTKMTSAQPSGTMLTRTVCVNITGSLANLAMAGPQAAIWKPVEGKQAHVFGIRPPRTPGVCLAEPQTAGMGAELDAAAATNQLRTALIHDVSLLEHRSTFPVPMGVDINCVPKHVSPPGFACTQEHTLTLAQQELTDVGDAYAFTVLPHSIITSPHTVYKCDASAEEGHQWRKYVPLPCDTCPSLHSACLTECMHQRVPQVHRGQPRERGRAQCRQLPVRLRAPGTSSSIANYKSVSKVLTRVAGAPDHRPAAGQRQPHRVQYRRATQVRMPIPCFNVAAGLTQHQPGSTTSGSRSPAKCSPAAARPSGRRFSPRWPQTTSIYSKCSSTGSTRRAGTTSTTSPRPSKTSHQTPRGTAPASTSSAALTSSGSSPPRTITWPAYRSSTRSSPRRDPTNPH